MTELLPADTVGSVFLRGEALAAGYSEREITGLVRAGQWIRLRRGAYIASPVWEKASRAERHALLARAVLKQARTEVVLSHLSALPEYAAPMWGLQVDVVHLTRRDHRAGRKEAGVRQHQGVLEREDVVVRRGVEVTSATRTAIDVTTVADTEASLCVVNHLLKSGATTPAALAERYQSMQSHPYTLRTDLVLRLADPRIESVGESRCFYLFWRHGLPAPEPQYVIRDERGREIARLDFAWPEHGVWMEFDGKQKYSTLLRPGESAADVVVREKRREDRVRELTGWRCIRVTWAELADPERLAARIRAALLGPDAS